MSDQESPEVKLLGKIADLSSGFGHDDDDPDVLLTEIHQLACSALLALGYVRIVYPRKGMFYSA